jgi:hypothetical protein
MKQKAIRVENEKVFEDYKFQSGYYEGIAIYDVITAETQRDAFKYGLTLEDLLDLEQETRGDWQRDC